MVASDVPLMRKIHFCIFQKLLSVKNISGAIFLNGLAFVQFKNFSGEIKSNSHSCKQLLTLIEMARCLIGRKQQGEYTALKHFFQLKHTPLSTGSATYQACECRLFWNNHFNLSYISKLHKFFFLKSRTTNFKKNGRS